MIDQPPPLILPDHWAAKRPAIIRPELDPQRHFPVQIGRAERRAVQTELLRQGRADAMLPGMVPVIAGGRLEGNDGYTVLLLHADGTNGSTSFPDSSAASNSVSVFGNAQVDTSQSRFGGGSLKLDGSGDYLKYAAASSWDFGTGPFTIDLWVRPNSTPAEYDALFTTRNGAGTWKLIFFSATLYCQLNNSLGVGDNAAITNGLWTHYAVVRNGTSAYMFRNGTLVGTTAVGSTSFNSNGQGVEIGRADLGVNNATYFDGWMDEIRISKGVARWTSNFTPPTTPYGP
jgi:hypothetical protein